MARVLFRVVAIVAFLVIVESLTCNKCNFGFFGLCIGNSTETCAANTSVCFTGKATFPSVPSFSGFSTQGCLDNITTCNATINGSVLFASYQSALNCCSTDNCNPKNIINGSPTTKMTLTAALGAAIVAFMWGTML